MIYNTYATLSHLSCIFFTSFIMILHCFSPLSLLRLSPDPKNQFRHDVKPTGWNYRKKQIQVLILARRVKVKKFGRSKYTEISKYNMLIYYSSVRLIRTFRHSLSFQQKHHCWVCLSFWNQEIRLTCLLEWSALFKNLLLIWICNYMFSLESCKRLAHLTEAECSTCRTGKGSIASASIQPCSLDESQNLCMGRYFMKLI